MGSHKTKGTRYQESAHPPVADYNVTGEVSPDCTCNYFLAGTYGGKNYYRRTDSAWFLWWKETWDSWMISSGLGVITAAYWEADSEIVATYQPEGEAEGDAYVAEGPH